MSVSVQSFGELPRVGEEVRVLFEFGEHLFHPVDPVEEFGILGCERENLAPNALFFVLDFGSGGVVKNLPTVPAELGVVVVEFFAPRTLDGFDVLGLRLLNFDSVRRGDLVDVLVSEDSGVPFRLVARERPSGSFVDVGFVDVLRSEESLHRLPVVPTLMGSVDLVDAVHRILEDFAEVLLAKPFEVPVSVEVIVTGIESAPEGVVGVLGRMFVEPLLDVLDGMDERFDGTRIGLGLADEGLVADLVLADVLVPHTVEFTCARTAVPRERDKCGIARVVTGVGEGTHLVKANHIGRVWSSVVVGRVGGSYPTHTFRRFIAVCDECRQSLVRGAVVPVCFGVRILSVNPRDDVLGDALVFEAVGDIDLRVARETVVQSEVVTVGNRFDLVAAGTKLPVEGEQRVLLVVGDTEPLPTEFFTTRFDLLDIVLYEIPVVCHDGTNLFTQAIELLVQIPSPANKRFLSKRGITPPKKDGVLRPYNQEKT